MTEEQQLDKAIAALTLGEVLLTNMNNEIKVLKQQKQELLDVLEQLAFTANTIGGVAGRDAELCLAVMQAYNLIEELKA